MFIEQLKNAGLTDVQADIYSYLLTKKEAKASIIARESNRPRGVAYKGLDELVEMGLVNKTDEANMVSIFKAEHPSRLEKIVDIQERKLKEVKDNFGSLLPELSSQFNLTHNKPNVSFSEGLKGIEKVYTDILNQNKDFLLIRPGYEPNFEKEALPTIERFINNRVKKNIKVKAITPTDVPEDKRLDDEKNLMERTWIKKEHYNAPVEFNIFGDKVAITSYGQEFISMTIESPQIALAMKQLFNLISNKTPETNEAEKIHKYV